MSRLVRIRRFARTLVSPGQGIWRSPIVLRLPVVRHSVRSAWRQADPHYIEKLRETLRGFSLVLPDPWPPAPPGTRGVYEGPVTVNAARAYVMLDALGDFGTPVEDWIAETLGAAPGSGTVQARIELLVLPAE